ncbi:MAG TPA: AAA family ATPase [bacterium]
MSDRSKLIRMTIKNFGCVGNDGLTVELDKIVCLVGANNTGKSTVLRAYEAAVNQLELKREDINSGAGEQPASIELWVHIPQGAGNVGEDWKEKVEDLLLVRSKWEWSPAGGKPVRTTWNPSANEYAADGKASGLDNVFNSRLPKPFRIGALEDPEEEHKKLLTLVLEPVANKLKGLMGEEDSMLRKNLLALKAEAEKPVEEFRKDIEAIESQINKSYRNIFSAAEIKLTVSLGDIAFKPDEYLRAASRIDVSEPHGRTRWDQQGTGSKRALFWLMLQVRSALNRIAEERRKTEATLKKKEKDLAELNKKLPTLKKQDAIDRCKSEIESLNNECASLKESASRSTSTADSFLPGYMLLIEEPETALHPSAVRAAKEHLYSLADDDGWQVMLSTHHPAFVDPLKDHTTIVRLHRPEIRLAPNVYRADTLAFSPEEKDNLKRLLIFDTTVAEMFFGCMVVIVEGDTEFAAFEEMMRRETTQYPLDSRPLLLRARGKATIPTLIKMLVHFKMDFAVLHDTDRRKCSDGLKDNPAYSVNAAIAKAVGEGRVNGCKIVHRCSCPGFEQHHGMKLPRKDKPYHAWIAVTSDNKIGSSVREVLNILLGKISSDPSDNEDGQRYETLYNAWENKNNGSKLDEDVE